MTSEIIEVIEKQKKLEEIDELILDEIIIDKFTLEEKNCIESLEDFFLLSMNDCQLKSLENFPNIKQLVRLELNYNPFSIS